MNAKKTWLDRAIDDAAHHSIDLVATDLRTARGYLESALEILDRRLTKVESFNAEPLHRIRDVITKALAVDVFAAPAAATPATSDLRRVLTESIAYACDQLKRSPSTPEVRVAVAITANVERVQRRSFDDSASVVAAFRKWRDETLVLRAPTGVGVSSWLTLAEIYDAFQAHQREDDGADWADLSPSDVGELLTELFQVRLGREDGQRVVYGLRWRTP